MQTIEIAQIDDKGYFNELFNNIRNESQQLHDEILNSKTQNLSLDEELKKVVKDLEKKEE